jgi:hypothetical protein
MMIEANVLGASNAGMRAILFTGAAALRKSLGSNSIPPSGLQDYDKES